MTESIDTDADLIWQVAENMSNSDSPGRLLINADQIIAAAERIKIIARLRQTVEVVSNDDND